MAARFDLKLNLGILEIGSWVSTFLLGVSIMQAYTYFRNFFTSDRWQLKSLVLVVFFCELAHTGATTSAFFKISIILYGQPEEIFRKSPLGYTVSTFLSGVIASSVQAYFAHRMGIVTNKMYLTYISWFLSLLRFLGTVGITVMLLTRSLAEFQGTWLAAVTWSIGIVVDVFIAVSLTTHLARERKEAIRNRKLLDHVIAMTMQTGLLTSLSTVVVTICFIAAPHTLLWGAVGSALAKIFSISLYVSLNARSYLRAMSDTASNLLSQELEAQMGLPVFPVNPSYNTTMRSEGEFLTQGTSYHSVDTS